EPPSSEGPSSKSLSSRLLLSSLGSHRSRGGRGSRARPILMAGCRLRCMRAPYGSRIGDRHLSRFEDLLETAKIVTDLLTRLLPEQLQHRCAELAPRGFVLQLHGNLCPPVAG